MPNKRVSGTLLDEMAPLLRARIWAYYVTGADGTNILPYDRAEWIPRPTRTPYSCCSAVALHQIEGNAYSWSYEPVSNSLYSCTYENDKWSCWAYHGKLTLGKLFTEAGILDD